VFLLPLDNYHGNIRPPEILVMKVRTEDLSGITIFVYRRNFDQLILKINIFDQNKGILK